VCTRLPPCNLLPQYVFQMCRVWKKIKESIKLHDSSLS
jgi:hypothetical protein